MFPLFIAIARSENSVRSVGVSSVQLVTSEKQGFAFAYVFLAASSDFMFFASRRRIFLALDFFFLVFAYSTTPTNKQSSAIFI